MNLRILHIVFLLSLFHSLDLVAQCSPDTTPPTITCPANVTAPCPQSPLLDALEPTTSDNCGAVTLQTYTLGGATNGSSPATGIHNVNNVIFRSGTTTVNYYIEDSSGNSASCSFTVTVTDNTAPIIVCQDDLTRVNDTGLCTAYVNMFALDVFPTAFDSCSGITTVPTNVPPGSNFPVGTTTVIWEVTDAAGNVSTCPQDVTVTDEEDPTISCPANITVNTDPGVCSANVTIPLAVANDNCTISSVVNDYNGGGANASGNYPIGTTTVTFTATDHVGRTVSCSMSVTVVNSQSPTITLNGANPINLEACDTYNELGATANDTCSGNITADIIIDTSGLDTDTVGSYNVIYSVTNAAGNTTQEIRTVNVVDTTNPSLSLIGPNPLTVGDCSTFTELGASAIDPCFGDISGNVVIDNSSVDTSTLGSYTVTYSVVDDSGNSGGTITRTVNVVDSTPPDIFLIGDNPQIIEACTPYTELGATALDPCFNIDFTSAIMIDASNVDTNVVGTYTVTYNVSDSFGNAAFEVIRDVEVVDTTVPTINCPSDITVDNDSGECSAIVNYSTPVGIDNCPVTTNQTAGLPSGSAFPIGTTTNTFEVNDGDGNTSTCSFDVIVNDVELPIAICTNISLQLDPSTGNASIVPSDIDDGSTDNCNFTLSLSQDTFDCSDIGDNIVTLTVTDDSGNLASCDATVTITDLAEGASITISESTNPICPGESVTFTAVANSGSTTPTYQWQINGTAVSGETASTFTTNSLNDGDEVSVLLTSNATFCTPIISSNIITMTVNDVNPPADAGPDISNSVCTNTTITLSAAAIVGNNTTGLWTVTSSQTSGFSFSDDTSPTSTFTGDIGETYTLTWSLDNPDPCPDSSDTMTVTFVNCNALDFDGVDDNITFRNNFNLINDFSIELWIKSELVNNDVQTVFSKREANAQLDGYDLRVVNGYVSFNWDNGNFISSPHPLVNNQWHHVALTHAATTYKLYIDGIEMANGNGTAPLPNTVDCILGAMDQTLVPPFKPLNYFDGGMDEFRIWDVALTETQIRKMMNQEIEDTTGNILGRTVPLEISGLAWSDLNAYYRMNQATDISAGNLVSNNGNSVDGLLRYMTTLQPETAPIPYLSTSNGNWTSNATWLHGNVQAIPNSTGIDSITEVDWNIVETSHNISSGDNNIILLGLKVNSNRLAITNTDPNNGQSLRITDYLKINGILDLVGESQLLQDENSIVDYTGTGSLERDQQGTTNLFNYNYWGSPVNNGGTTFSVGNVLNDGSNINNPIPINWITGYNASGSTNPISLSNRWIYTYENSPENSYSDWIYKSETGNISVGLGFTLKGSGVGDPVNDFQNYTFIGQPGNGIISNTISSTFQVLVGNPYPSSIDANAFINENGPSGFNSIDGTLYFWEQASTNSSHVLAQYEGGYASYNLSGGVAAVTPPSEIGGLGDANKIPGRYIPVAQGFYVTGGPTAGNVTFTNTQRVFHKESDGDSTFFRLDGEASDDGSEEIQRVRLDFTSIDGAVRHLLLAFTPDNAATDGVDYGYDAPNTENLPNDLSWLIDGEHFVIQGVGAFDVESIYPLSMQIANAGMVSITLTDLENFESPIDVFVYDSFENNYHPLHLSDFQSSLETGSYSNRYFITFMDDESLDIRDDILDATIVQYLNATDEIFVKIPASFTIQKVELINLLGQQVAFWDVFPAENSSEVRIPVEHISEAAYVVKVTTSSGQGINKKVIVKY